MQKYGNTSKIVTFTDYVFENAVTGNLIFLYQKGGNQISAKEYVYRGNGLFEPYSPPINEELINKLETHVKPLQEIANLFKGMVIKNRDVVLHDNPESWPHRFLLGKNISKWSIDSYYYTDYKCLEIIGGTKKIEKHKVSPRIVIRRTGNELCCALLGLPSITESTLYSCWPKGNEIDIRYLYGLLNSRLLNYYNRNKNVTNQQGFPQILMTDLQQLPIKIGNREQINSIVSAIDSIEEREIKAVEEEINFLVYHLYNLTYDEVLIVDPETPITREEYESSNSK